MILRPETPADAAPIRQLTARAFAETPYSSGTEPAIVDALRAADALTLSLVMEADDGAIVGHIAFSPVQIGGASGPWVALGPISVLPGHQRQRIGSALIREGLAQMAARGAQLCVLLGDPAYYARFGFSADNALSYLGESSPYLQHLLLSGALPTGEVHFHPAFDTPPA